jgi:hypothetical protein
LLKRSANSCAVCAKLCARLAINRACVRRSCGSCSTPSTTRMVSSIRAICSAVGSRPRGIINMRTVAASRGSSMARKGAVCSSSRACARSASCLRRAASGGNGRRRPCGRTNKSPKTRACWRRGRLPAFQSPATFHSSQHKVTTAYADPPAYAAEHYDPISLRHRRAAAKFVWTTARYVERIGRVGYYAGSACDLWG